MEVQQDFRDLLELFNKNKVDYIIVGAYALGFHGARHPHTGRSRSAAGTGVVYLVRIPGDAKS